MRRSAFPRQPRWPLAETTGRAVGPRSASRRTEEGEGSRFCGLPPARRSARARASARSPPRATAGRRVRLRRRSASACRAAAPGSPMATQRAGSRPGKGIRAKPASRWTSNASAASSKRRSSSRASCAHVSGSVIQLLGVRNPALLGSARARGTVRPANPHGRGRNGSCRVSTAVRRRSRTRAGDPCRRSAAEAKS